MKVPELISISVLGTLLVYFSNTLFVPGALSFAYEFVVKQIPELNSEVS